MFARNTVIMIVACMGMLLSVSACTQTNQAGFDSEAQIDYTLWPNRPSAQIKPVHDLMLSIKRADIELFKQSFDQRLSAKFAKEGWDKVFVKYTVAIRVKFGDYQMSDLNIHARNSTSIVVEKHHIDKSPEPITVRIDDGNWKISSL